MTKLYISCELEIMLPKCGVELAVVCNMGIGEILLRSRPKVFVFCR